LSGALFSLLFFDGSTHVSEVDRGVIFGTGLGSNARGIKKLSPSPPLTSEACEIAEWRLFRYVVVGRVNPSLVCASLDVRSGDRSGGRLELLLDDESFCV
jgi:hypothetical protein